MDREKLNQTVDKINDLIKVCRQCYTYIKPTGLSVLREIRENPKLSKIPVLIYTRYGNVTMDEEDMREAIKLKANWMFKGRTAEFEQRLMHFTITNHARSQKIQRDVKLAVYSSIFSAILGAIFGWTMSKYL